MKESVIYERREMLTVSAVARRWGVSKQTVLNRIEEGKIRAFRFGFSKAWFVPSVDLRQLEAGREVMQ